MLLGIASCSRCHACCQDLEDLARDQGAGSPIQEQVDPLGHVASLQGFPLVGISTRSQLPGDRQTAMWREARKDCEVSMVPVDKTENTYRMDEGPFVAPKLPSSLPVSKRTIEADNGLLQAQQNWQTMGMVVCKGILMVGRPSKNFFSEPTPHSLSLTDVCHRLRQDGAEPSGHPTPSEGGFWILFRRRGQIHAQALHEQQLPPIPPCQLSWPGGTGPGPGQSTGSTSSTLHKTSTTTHSALRLYHISDCVCVYVQDDYYWWFVVVMTLLHTAGHCCLTHTYCWPSYRSQCLFSDYVFAYFRREYLINMVIPVTSNQ